MTGKPTTKADKALNIVSTPRLGDVERAVMRELARMTFDDNLLFVLGGRDPLTHYHADKTSHVPRRELFFACGYLWADRKTTTATASFSRAVHSLFDKGLICGLALAWIYVEKDTSGAWKADDLWAYAGPGRKTDESPPGSKYADLQKPPVLSRVGLTSLGWWIVHQDNPEEGLCPLCKQIVERDGYPTPDD